jgi:hypothetical protein
MKNPVIEVMKAFAISGIVLLHAIFIEVGGNTNVSVILRLVAIKTLLVLSGYVVYGKITKKGWLSEKIVRRLPILVIFTFVYWLYASNVAGIDGGVKLDVSLGTYYVYNFATGFIVLVIWYIWVLILCYVLIWLFEKYVAGKLLMIPYLAKLGVLAFVIIWIPYDYFGIGFVRWYGLFMFGGYALRYALENYQKFKKYTPRIAYSAIVLFPLSIYLVQDAVNYDGQWVSTGFINIANALKAGEGKYIITYLLVTFTGITFVYILSKLVASVKYLSFPFIKVGEATIGILLFHKMFLELKALDNYWLAALVAEVIAIGLYLVIKRVKALDWLLFGGTSIPIKMSEKLEVWYEKAKA